MPHLVRLAFVVGLLVMLACNTPAPTPTPDFGSMVDACKLARKEDRASYTRQLSQGFPEGSPMPSPVEGELDKCREFRGQFPDEYARLMGNTISGTLTLSHDRIIGLGWTAEEILRPPLGKACVGSGGYGDLQGGVRVVVKDGQGKVIATGALWDGRLERRNTCVFPFQVIPVPNAEFYEIEVGRRGSQTFSHSELESNDWSVRFHLGR